MTKIVTFWGGESDIPCQPANVFTHVVFIFPFSTGKLARIMLDERVPCQSATTFFATTDVEVMKHVEDALKSYTTHEGLQMTVTDL